MININASYRLKEKNRDIRKKGYIPGIVYGNSIKNELIKILYSDFENVLKETGKSTIANLKIKEGKEYPVLIREIQKDPISENFIHVDFYHVQTDREVEATVDFDFIGEAPAEKNFGAVVVKNIHEIEIKAFPKDLISKIKVDISSLENLEDEIKIKDLKISEKVKILALPEEIIVKVIEPEKEKIKEEAAEEKPEEIEVIEKSKKEDEEESENNEKEEKNKK